MGDGTMHPSAQVTPRPARAAHLATAVWAYVDHLPPQPGVGMATLGLALASVTAAWLLGHQASTVAGTLAAAPVCLALGGAIVTAYHFPLPLGRQATVQMASVAYYLLAALVPPSLAAVVAGSGALLGEVSVRRQRGNTASDISSAVGRRMLIVVLGSMVAHLPGGVMVHTLALVGGAVLMGALDLLTFPLVVAPMRGHRPVQVLGAVPAAVSLGEGAQYLVGLLGALAAAQEFWVLGLLILPTALVYLSLRAMAVATEARRAAELAHAQVRAAQEVRDAFLTAASHDLRTPLAIIQGHTDLLQMRLERGGAIDAGWVLTQLEPVQRGTRRMAATVEEITDAALLQMGQDLMLRSEPLDLSTLVRDVVGGTVLLSPTRVVLEASVPVMVAGDRARLERVVQNLLDNALKYSLEGTPIQVAVQSHGSWATLTVRDSGIGIPAEEVPHLFTPFFRASTARGIPGSGIGLAGAKRLVEQGAHAELLARNGAYARLYWKQFRDRAATEAVGT
ncbi:MAG: hypothetical protein NVSMB65_18810 [Chloroflexota bacterium]